MDKIYNLGFKNVKVASYDCSSFQLLRELSEKFDELIISTEQHLMMKLKNQLKY